MRWVVIHWTNNALLGTIDVTCMACANFSLNRTTNNSEQRRTTANNSEQRNTRDCYTKHDKMSKFEKKMRRNDIDRMKNVSIQVTFWGLFFANPKWQKTNHRWIIRPNPIFKIFSSNFEDELTQQSSSTLEDKKVIINARCSLFPCWSLFLGFVQMTKNKPWNKPWVKNSKRSNFQYFPFKFWGHIGIIKVFHIARQKSDHQCSLFINFMLFIISWVCPNDKKQTIEINR